MPMARALDGVTVVEFAGLGPGPFCCMMLADMGADIIRIERAVPGGLQLRPTAVDRGRRRLPLNLKQPAAVDVALRAIEKADVLVEGFRPGVMERLGLGPDVCLARNPRLVYGRMTGWGQSGPLAHTAGHDLNYIALTGVLHAMGHADRPPTPPLHLVGDMGGGAMMLAYGIVCALLEARRSGQGQVIDAAISDGASLLASVYHDRLASGAWQNRREANLLDGGAHFYGCYACADGRYVALGAIEPQFYRLLLEGCGIEDADFEDQLRQAAWPELRRRLQTVFLRKTRDEWCAVFAGSDACVTPVLDFDEAARHPHAIARDSFLERDGARIPAPAPRLSRTPARAAEPLPGDVPLRPLLAELGFSDEEADALVASGAAGGRA